MAEPNPARTRDDVLKELELILEAKKNINSIITTLYAVFYSLEGFLLYGFYVLTQIPARASLGFFRALCLGGLLLVTLRTQGTNHQCDLRGAELESKFDLKVFGNYDNSSEIRWPNFLFRATMHGTLMVVDAGFIVMWIVLVSLAFAGVI